MNAKLAEDAKDFVRAEASTGNMRGARAWTPVQVFAAGFTQNRRAELQSELNIFKRVASFVDLAVVLPKWERKVRDFDHFPQSGVTDEAKMDVFFRTNPTSVQQFTSALISAGGYNYEKLRKLVDSQFGQNRTAMSYDQGARFGSKDPSGRSSGSVHGADTENAQNSNSGSNTGAECDPWQDWKDDGISEGFDGGGVYRIGKGGWYFVGTRVKLSSTWPHLVILPSDSRIEKMVRQWRQGLGHWRGLRNPTVEQGRTVRWKGRRA